MVWNQMLARAGLPALLTTAEVAALERINPQTIRKNFCLQGHHHGMKPIKLPGGALRWSSASLAAILDGETV
jgi:hypothetical protein